MKSRNLLGLIFLSTLILSTCQQDTSGTKETVSSADAGIELKIDSLLALMTLEEKVGQMVQYTGDFELTGPKGGNVQKKEEILAGRVGSMLNVVGVRNTREFQEAAVNDTRLGIPLIFGYDVVHGFQTMFPLPLAEAASWDMEAIEQSASVAAMEATAAGLHWTFAPMVDISRDARWGRVMEGAGEDPFLGSKIAAARVRGFQGKDLADTHTMAACAKHFAAYGFAEGGRDYNTVDISERTLRNTVLPPFKAAVDAGVATVMNAFNEIGGIPATASTHLQRDILKGAWDFRGFVVSDWGSIEELVDHGVAKDKKEAAFLAIKAGSDMDMEGYSYNQHLVSLVEEGAVDRKHIDDAVRRILRIKFKLGLFEDPFRYCNEDREKNIILSQEHLEIARDMARKSIVLLKNDNDLLPLRKANNNIAVIGPLAADKDVPLGSWRARAITGSATSLLEGVQAAVEPSSRVQYAEGAALTIGDRSFTSVLQFNTDDRSGFSKAAAIARNADVVIMALGEDCFQSGEGRSQSDIDLKGLQLELLKEIYKVNKKIVVVLMNGRPLAIGWMAENIPSIVEAWHLGSMAGPAIADVLFGDYNPSGKLPVSFPHSVGQLPLYYNHKNTGRPVMENNPVFFSRYTDVPKTALFPFGYGLSYTSFEYSDLTLSSASIAAGESLDVKVIVKNTGDRAGEEVVQCYLRDLVGSVTRPVKELKAFEKISLDPGASREVTFTLSTDDLRFYNIDMDYVAEPGDFMVFVGTNSEEVLEASFTLR